MTVDAAVETTAAPTPAPQVDQEPAEAEDNEREDYLDIPTYLRMMRAVHYRPLTWTKDLPVKPGWWHARMPGGRHHAIVCVMRDDDGELIYGVTAVKWSRVEDSDLEWGSAAIATPYGGNPR